MRSRFCDSGTRNTSNLSLLFSGSSDKVILTIVGSDLRVSGVEIGNVEPIDITLSAQDMPIRSSIASHYSANCRLTPANVIASLFTVLPAAMSHQSM
jgi:hypothetical protein